jgi:hypothetical protein
MTRSPGAAASGSWAISHKARFHARPISTMPPLLAEVYGLPRTCGTSCCRGTGLVVTIGGQPSACSPARPLPSLRCDARSLRLPTLKLLLSPLYSLPDRDPRTWSAGRLALASPEVSGWAITLG